MLIAKLSLSFDRGVAFNKAEDLGLDEEPTQTDDGGIIRGLGTRYRSEADRLLAKEREREDLRVRTAFRRRFLLTPLDGVFLIPASGAAREFLDSLNVRADVQASVQEFNLTSEKMDGQTVNDWATRVKGQFSKVPLGRGKETDEDGLKALETLAECPAISKATRNRVLELVAGVRLKTLDRFELRRQINVMEVEVDPNAFVTRRVPVMDKEVMPTR